MTLQADLALLEKEASDQSARVEERARKWKKAAELCGKPPAGA